MTNFQHILITGAAGAIGSALLKVLAKQFPQARFTLVDVNEHRLQQHCATLGARARYVCWDLFIPDNLAAQWHAAMQNVAPVDLLINCAGIMDIMSFAGTGWERGWKLLSVNFISPMRLADLALRDMPVGGVIVNIASMAGRVPMTGCAYYGGAKAGMGLASEIMHDELKPKGIHVVTVYPGPIYSALESHARSQVQRGIISRLIPTGRAINLANKIVVAITQRQSRVIYPSLYATGHYLNTFAGLVVRQLSPQPRR